MYKWLVLELRAPLMSFGGVSVDHFNKTDALPGASMLTGLIGAALGLHMHYDAETYGQIQRGLVFGAKAIVHGEPVEDVQNAELRHDDKGWTTRGRPDDRAGSSYGGPHRRWRDYLSGAVVGVVIRVASGSPYPLAEIEAALRRPAQALFLGRASCPPSAPLVAARPYVEGKTVYDALSAYGVGGKDAVWPDGEGPEGELVRVRDLRDWSRGLHMGSRLVVVGETRRMAESWG